MSEIRKITSRNLIEHPQKNGHFAVVWETKEGHEGERAFPGGRKKRGESPLDAARREAWEETDLNVTPTGLIRLPDISDPTHHRILFRSIVDAGQEDKLLNPGRELVTEFLTPEEIAALRDADMLRHVSMPEDIARYQKAVPHIGFGALDLYMGGQQASMGELASV